MNNIENLMQELCIEVGFSGMKLSPEQKNIYDKARLEFDILLGKNLTGTKLVKKVFSITDELNELYSTNNPLSCHKGCGWCCFQLVCCTTLEAELIIDYLQKLPRGARNKVIAKWRIESIWLNNKIKLKYHDGPPPRWEMITGYMMSLYYGTRHCLFLDPIRKVCRIYPVRPIDCRVAKTHGRVCGKIQAGQRRPDSERHRVRLLVDQIASDIIMDEERRLSGSLQVVPLGAWPLTHSFSKHLF